MCETDLRFILEEKDLMVVDSIMEEETFCDVLEIKNMTVEVIRMAESGSYSVFITKDSHFTESEVMVAENFLKRHKRTIDIIGDDRIGVKLDSKKDIRPFNMMDRMFHYKKTYKTQSFARMLGVGVANSIREYHASKPDKIEYLYQNLY